MIDNSSFPGPHLATVAKSRSTIDLSTRSNGYNSDVNSPHCDEPHVELDPWNRDRQRRLGVESRQHDPTYQNTPSHGRMELDPTNSNRSRVHHDSSAASSMYATSISPLLPREIFILASCPYTLFTKSF